MTPALILTAALSLGQQPPPPAAPQPPSLPKAPADAPRGLPVVLGYVTADDAGRISGLTAYPVQRQEVRDVTVRNPATGRNEVRKQTVTVTATEFGLTPIAEKAVRITTLDGKPVAYAEAARQVKGGKVVAMVWAFEDKKADQAYLKALKEGTLVFEMQPEPPPGGGAPPPKK